MVYVTYEAVIYRGAVDYFDGALVAKDCVGVGTRQSDGVDAVGLQVRYEVLVDQSAIYHGDYFQHSSISDAASIDHLCLDAQTLSHFGGLTTTAMYQYLATLNSRKVA